MDPINNNNNLKGSSTATDQYVNRSNSSTALLTQDWATQNQMAYGYTSK